MIVCVNHFWSHSELALHHVSVSTLDPVTVMACQAVRTLFCFVICRQVESCALSSVAFAA